jgi:hypothetical protein
MGKYRTVKIVKPSGEDIRECPPYERAAVGLEMPVSDAGVILCTEKPHRVDACCMDNLFRGIGAKISNALFPLSLHFPGIAVGIGRYLLEFLN